MIRSRVSGSSRTADRADVGSRAGGSCLHRPHPRGGIPVTVRMKEPARPTSQAPGRRGVHWRSPEAGGGWGPWGLSCSLLTLCTLGGREEGTSSCPRAGPTSIFRPDTGQLVPWGPGCRPHSPTHQGSLAEAATSVGEQRRRKKAGCRGGQGVCSVTRDRPGRRPCSEAAWTPPGHLPCLQRTMLAAKQWEPEGGGSRGCKL